MLNDLFSPAFSNHTFKNWVMQNHHLTSISTSPKKNARPNFLAVDPIWGALSCGCKKRPLVSIHTMIRHYAVYSLDPQFLAVLTFLDTYRIEREVHLNRTRFWIDDSLPEWALLVLKFYGSIHDVSSESDHSLGV